MCSLGGRRQSAQRARRYVPCALGVEQLPEAFLHLNEPVHKHLGLGLRLLVQRASATELALLGEQCGARLVGARIRLEACGLGPAERRLEEVDALLVHAPLRMRTFEFCMQRCLTCLEDAHSVN